MAYAKEAIGLKHQDDDGLMTVSRHPMVGIRMGFYLQRKHFYFHHSIIIE
jgi:hypothetical protein